MSNKAKILEDVTRLAGGSVGILNGLRGAAKESIHYRAADLAQKVNLVPYEDFERLEEMVKQSRIEQESLTKRIIELEKQLNKKSKAKK